MELHPGERVVFSGHPNWRSTLDLHLKGLLAAVVAGAIVWFAADHALGVAVALAVLVVFVLVGIVIRAATHYDVTTERLRIRRGILTKRVQETRLDRVQNVNTRQSLLERALRIGTVDFDTAGTQDSDFVFRGVANPNRVAQAINIAEREAHGDPARERPDL